MIYSTLTGVFVIFAQMLVHGIKSIELPNAVKRRELGLVWGMEPTPSRMMTFSLWQRLAVRSLNN